jgi:hypothetical protein
MSRKEPEADQIEQEMAEVDDWDPSRMAAAQAVTLKVLEYRGRPEDMGATAIGVTPEALRDWVILTGRRLAEQETERRRRLEGRTRTTPIEGCEDYDPSEFWKAFERFKSALQALERLDGDLGRSARASAAAAFRGGPLPVSLPDSERSLVCTADDALTAVRAVLSAPAATGRVQGGRKSLETDMWTLEQALQAFERLLGE